MNIQFLFNKLYYKYIDTSTVNHYKLLLLTEEYRQIGKNYFYKYPNAQGWKNLNKELFDSNKQSEIEYMQTSKKQSEIKKDFFKNREIICKSKNNKDCIICSDYFHEFYVERNYHYGQCTELVIEDVKTDILNMDKKLVK
jgi:endonuclease IV